MNRTKTEKKIHLIKPTLSVWEFSLDTNRRLEVPLRRLRIRQTRSKHCYLPTNDDPPVCQHYGGYLDVLRLLRLRPNLERQRFISRKILRQHIPFHPVFLL